MRKAMAGALLAILVFSGKAFSEQYDSKPVVWPDYSTWTVVQIEPFEPSVGIENQNYSAHLAALKLELGNVKVYVDNPDRPLLGVAEISVLGNGVVLRNLIVVTPVGVLAKDLQLLINGKWESGTPNSLSVYLVNPKKWLFTKGELGEVVLMLKGNPPVKLVLKEKQ